METLLELIADIISSPASAQSFIVSGIRGCNFATGDINGPLCIPNFIAHVIKTIFAFAGGIFIFMMIFAGYEIVLGALPGGSAEAGKNRITWAIIGFIVSATSFFIIDFIIAAIGG